MVSNDGKLTGKTALITGGTHGIGLEIARAFVREGAHVAVNYHRPYDAERGFSEAAVADELQAIDSSNAAIEADVADEGAVASLCAEVLERLGTVDILVNNAGFVSLSPLESMTTAMWDRMIAVHLRGAFLVTRGLLPHMLAQRWGRIINVASQIAQIGKPEYVHYAAAKGGIIALTKALSREVADRGVLVNAIAPGPVTTGIVPRPTGGPPPSYDHLPLKRPGQACEVAPTAVFLASDDSSYYVGQTLCPNGGEVML